MKSRQPLIALDAVVLDTETTGLDPARARVVQIGALRLRRGAIQSEDRFDRLVNPDEAISDANSRIHGITNAMVAGEPRFSALWPLLHQWLGESIIIGHNIGYDLAVFARECQLAGLEPPRNPLLDTRFLGEIAFPRLGGFTLDALASHLGIRAENRHNALADAEITARVFLALLPHLKQHSIQTLAEAEAACRSKSELIDQLNRAGWAEPVRPSASPDSVLARIDAYPFRHRVRDVAAMPPVTLPPDANLAAAIKLMAEKRISSVFVAPDAPGEPFGIITERDVIRLVAQSGGEGLLAPIGPLATRPLLTVPAEAFIYRAIGRMETRHIRHLGVTDDAGRVIGALSARDLLRLRSSDALALGDAVDEAHSIADLAAAWARIAEVSKRLQAEGVATPEIAAVVSREIGALTRRAAIEAEKAMLAEGHGPPPAPYAVLVLGSGGRGESLLIPDQDNATIFAGDPTLRDHEASDRHRWFLGHGAHMARVLDLVGIPLCKGKVMASNPAWNGDQQDWQRRIRSWTESTTPDDLLQVDIFFDCRHAHGDFALANSLISSSREMVRHARPMIKLLADQIRHWGAPIGLFGRLKLEERRVDLKKGGLLPIVSLARCLALAHGITERSTAGRIAAIRAMQLGAESDLDLFARAHTTLSTFILRQQLLDIEAGIPPSTRVDPAILSRSETSLLKDMLSAIGNASTVAHDLLFARTPVE